MAEITKYGANESKQHIKHDLRELPAGKSYGNESVDTTLSGKNYSLIRRGKNADEVNKYRTNLEKEIFKYNRKNLVHSVEVVIQLPADCPPEKEREFFQESYNYVVSKLPMGERCVVVAEVHKDEHKIVNGEDISKPHLHIMYVPAVPDTKKHFKPQTKDEIKKGLQPETYQYKLCADALTKRAALKAFHPGLQKHLDEKNIPATVIQKKEGDGKTLGLSVKQLKEITNKTGIVFNKSLTIDELANILKEHENIRLYDKEIQSRMAAYKTQIELLQKELEETKNKLAEVEKQHAQEVKNQPQEWGHSNTWGTTNTWGESSFSRNEEKLW